MSTDAKLVVTAEIAGDAAPGVGDRVRIERDETRYPPRGIGVDAITNEFY
jgi:hypothetical protein